MKRSMNYLLLGAAVSALMMASPATAQETSADARGVVTAPDGSPLAGQTVTIRDTRTGTTRTVTTSSSGSWSARGLRVGGPYIIEVKSDAYANERIEGITLNLGKTYEANFQLDEIVGGVEEIIVSASALNTASVAMGPSATFNLSDLETAPSINRDIKDVVRMDPRVYIDESNNDAIQCVGANPRFNSLTVDGVGLNDQFGLNSNGYPTEYVPFSFDSIQQVAVEMAPFDVEYGAFTGCNINAVTKSGTNELHGGAFFDYSSDSLRGTKVSDLPELDNGDYTIKRYGAHLGGPIIKDKLFFFASYEKLEGADLYSRRPGTEDQISQETYDRIAQIAQDKYGYTPGEFVASLPTEDEKILAKIDWNINDNHRLALVYNYDNGFHMAESDSDADEFEYSDHYYERGAKLEAYSGHLFSDWTDRLSTEIRVSYNELDNRQISRGNNEFGEVQIRTPEGVLVYLGTDDSRQSNDLYYKIWNYKAAANYALNDHELTFGVERADLEVFNMFVQHTVGEYRFTSIENFEAGIADRVYYGNAASQNPLDAAGTVEYSINTAYLQDEFSIPDADLTITAGVRYDWYENSGLPAENANFIARNGFSNATNFDGRGVFMPRLGFNWDATDALRVHGGVGIFSGGNPNVWLVNNYQNDGFSQIQLSARNVRLFEVPTANGGTPIKDIPKSLYDDVSSGTANTGVNAFDPDFKIPTQLKVALGATWDFDAGMFGDGYRLSADLLYSKMRNAAKIIDGTLVAFGTAPDGRPLYAATDKSIPGCAENPLTPGCARFGSSDLILTNTDGGEQKVFSIALSKDVEDMGISWYVGYAYTDATDVNPMTSSVAFSNFVGVAVSDANNPAEATTNWAIKHRLVGRFNWEHEFWDDNKTTLSLFGSLQSGRPYSFTYNGMGGYFDTTYSAFGDTVDDRHLIYVPTGKDDPLVNFVGDLASDAQQDAFFSYLESQGLMKYAGEIAPRNAFESDWWGKVDLRLAQEIPMPFEGHKITAYMVIENLTNLLDKDWGVQKHAGYTGHINVLDASIDRATNTYNYSGFTDREPQAIQTAPSQWEIRFGVNYKF
ncbi:TonB-dependent receptor [Pseudokordiimonas caeni]|uniref:TonB-dependent receptor n=1 Tax=Pseudokordiimonas caeni TaxID=2997908 RepID=UPI00281161CA|nr:carboxypeptidase regulatory-like domain-containing protein [Pseudokordiimonas caeni]